MKLLKVWQDTRNEKRRQQLLNDLVTFKSEIVNVRLAIHSDLETYKGFYKNGTKPVVLVQEFWNRDLPRVWGINRKYDDIQTRARKFSELSITDLEPMLNKFHIDVEAAYEKILSEQPDFEGALSIV